VVHSGAATAQAEPLSEVPSAVGGAVPPLDGGFLRLRVNGSPSGSCSVACGDRREGCVDGMEGDLAVEADDGRGTGSSRELKRASGDTVQGLAAHVPDMIREADHSSRYSNC